MKTYLWQVTLLASIQVSADTRATAEQKLRATAPKLSFASCEGELTVVGAEIEGAIDLIDVVDED